MNTSEVQIKLAELANLAAHYLDLKSQEKDMKKQMDKAKAGIKDLLDKVPNQLNGKHTEVVVDFAGTKILVRKQIAESVRTVDDIITRVRHKLPEDSETFIIIEEVLLDNALENMLAQNLITVEDLEEWTTTKLTESLIVQVAKEE